MRARPELLEGAIDLHRLLEAVHRRSRVHGTAAGGCRSIGQGIRKRGIVAGMRVGAGMAFLFLLTGCPTSGTVSQPLSDGGPRHVKPPPDTASCTGDPTMCLSGTASFSTAGSRRLPRRCRSPSFMSFRGGTQQPVSTQPVAKDGKSAFSGLDPDAGANAALPPWSHYYVQAAAGFVDGGIAPSALVGPLAVPSSGVFHPNLHPARTGLPRSSSRDWRETGGAFRPNGRCPMSSIQKGAEITPGDGGGARVAILIGGASIPLVWTTLSTGQGAYFAQLSPPLPAQATYSVTVSHPSLGDVGWQLVADPPTFDGTITAIDGGLLDRGGPPSP